MKKFTLAFCILFLAVAITSCSSSTSEKNVKSEDSQTETIVTDETLNKDRFLPEMVEVEKPIPVAVLHKAFYEWIDVEVTIAGYAKMYGNSEKIGKEVQIISSVGSYDVLFNCQFKEDLNKEIKSEDILIIKGSIFENSYWGIKIIDCELVEINGEFNKDEVPIPGKKAVFTAESLHKSFNMWIGKELTVIGNYNSTTTSSLNGNSTYRIDLDDPETNQKMVGCTMREEPDSDKLAANRKDIVIRGTVTKDLWGKVQLEDCVIVE